MSVQFGALANAAETYSCSADRSAGFNWSGGEWIPTAFPADEQLLVKPNGLKDGMLQYQVFRMGDQTPYLDDCSQLIYQGTPLARIACGGMAKGILIDTKRLRYQEIYGIGYLDAFDSEQHSPSITIGRCKVIAPQ